MYTIVFSLNILTVNKITAERHLVVGDAKLNQHKGTLTSKFGSMDMLLLWKRGSASVFTEDEKLWIPFRLIWFDRVRHPESYGPGDLTLRTASGQLAEMMQPHRVL